MKKSLWWVLTELKAAGLYVRWRNHLLLPHDAAYLMELDDTKPAEYRPLAKPGKALEYVTKVGDVYVQGGKVLHVYTPEGKGEKRGNH